MTWQSTLKNMRENWPDAVTQQSVCVILVQRLAALLQANARAALQEYGLSFTEFEILATLRSSPPPHELIPSALYDALLISSGGLTKVLKALEERALITRPDPPGDRRRRPIALTREGRRLAERGMRSVQKSDAARLQEAALSDAEYGQLARLLETALPPLEHRDPGHSVKSA